MSSFLERFIPSRFKLLKQVVEFCLEEDFFITMEKHMLEVCSIINRRSLISISACKRIGKG